MTLSIACKFLRLALGLVDEINFDLSEYDWIKLHNFAVKQSIVGFLYPALNKVPESSKTSKSLFLRWSMEAETVRGISQRMDSAASKLTQLFADQGCRSAILKGQANALLYPDPELRQSGDIDIWVEVGREKALEILSKMNLLKGASIGIHDVTLPAKYFGFLVEVHFQACSGNRNPFSNRRLQDYLNKELECISPCSKGFNVPSIKFALVMQLSHIQRHFLTVGIGLRQVVDYYFLLKSSTEDDRAEVGKLLNDFGLAKIAGALMWTLQEIFELDNCYLLCPVDSSRGKRFLRDVMEGGDFGQYSTRTKGSIVKWWIRGKIRLVGLLKYDFSEVSWQLLRYITDFFYKLPYRIKIARYGKIGKTIK